MAKLLYTVLALIICQSAFAADHTPQINPSSTAKAAVPTASTAPSKENYFESLFNEVEVAKTTPPNISSKQLYDKLSKDSVAYGVLKEYPNLQMGSLEFRPLSSTATHKQQIRQGQEMIRKEFSGDRPLSYKNVTDIINAKMTNPSSSMKDMDWVLMSNAFRTLKAPGTSHEAHLLGDFLAEYILLGEIKKQESKSSLASNDRSFLSTLYYDLSQLYKSMYKNDEKLFKESKNGKLNLPIAPIYRGSDYPEAYDQGYEVPFGTLVGRHLDLLGNSLIFDPYDDLGWAQLIDFAAFDLVDPWYYDEFYPDFWNSYLPYGFTTFDANRLRNKWQGIHGNMRHFRHLRENRPGMNRALHRLSRSAAPSSRLNRTIRNVSSPSALATVAGGHVSGTSITQGGVAPRAQIASTPREHARSASSARASNVLKSQRRAEARSSKPASSKHAQFPQIFRSAQNHGVSGGGGGGHAAAAKGGGGGGHAAAAKGGGGGKAPGAGANPQKKK